MEAAINLTIPQRVTSPASPLMTSPGASRATYATTCSPESSPVSSSPTTTSPEPIRHCQGNQAERSTKGSVFRPWLSESSSDVEKEDKSSTSDEAEDNGRCQRT